MNPVILLNAPPNAGKDTIAQKCRWRLGVPHLEFKSKLFELALSISGLKQEQWNVIYTRSLKDVPCDRLWGMSPREFLIDISERMVKPVCGQDYFGVQAANAAKPHGGISSDSGFNEEAEVLVDVLGAENVFCVRFTREGCSFEGDSRNFLTTDKIINYLDTTNDGTVEELVEEIVSWVESKT